MICKNHSISRGSECISPANCSWIKSNSKHLCELFQDFSALKGPSCSLVISGCVYSNNIIGHDNLCCEDVERHLQVDDPSLSSSSPPSVSSSAFFTNTNSPVISFSPVKSPSATTSCSYRIYNAAADFSSVQGKHGWYYGYYVGTVFTQFTNYAIGSTGSLGSVYSWNYNVNSNGNIGSEIIMPNGAGSCNTPTYGDITPVLRWYNPIGSCYQDITINLSLNHGSPNGGVVAGLSVNGVLLYSSSVAGVLSYSNSFNIYGVRSVELSIGPLNSICDYGQTSYTLNIGPIGPSFTALSSFSNTPSIMKSGSSVRSYSNSGSPGVSSSPGKSGTTSGSTSVSKSRSVSASNSRSPFNSRSPTHSASSTATVFYNGVWTDYGANYWNAPLQNIGSVTISECMTTCWSNPSCGGISVNPPCQNIALNSSDIFSVTCSNCFIIPIESLSGSGTFISHTSWKSFIYYDKIFPPTSSSRSTLTPTVSPRATSSVVTNSTWNFCANSGKSVTLPFIGSSAIVMTNAQGSTYTNGANCNIFFYGAGTSQMFDIYITDFYTEGGSDFFRVYNSLGQQVYTNSGHFASDFHIYFSGPFIQIGFNSGPSTVFSGVRAVVSLIYSSDSASASISRSETNSVSLSRTMAASPSVTGSASATSTVFYTGNWSDLGQYNYALGDIANIGSMTINRCQINCWQNPLCGLIVVTSPCNNIALDSPLVYTSVCSECWLKLTSGWVISADSVSKSFMLYDRVYPPTTTIQGSRSVSASPTSTTSVITYSSYNMCASSGLTLNLPYSGSSVLLRTNPIGSNYVDNAVCNFYVGGGSGKQFVISFSSFITESCCDPLTIYDSGGIQLYRNVGTVAANTTVYISGTNQIRILFTTDGSVVMSGIVFTVSVQDILPSATANSTLSISVSPASTVSPSSSNSAKASSSSSMSSSNTITAFKSRTSSGSASPRYSNSVHGTATGFFSVSKSPLASSTTTDSVSSSQSPGMSQSFCQSYSSSLSFSAASSPTPHTLSSSVSLSPSALPSFSATMSASNRKPAGPPPALPANLSALSLSALGGLFNDMANYPPTLIGDNLQKLGMAALANSPDGEFGISTSVFSVKVKALPAAAGNNSVPLSVGKTAISMPKIAGGAAASAIQWTSDPYNSPVTPDSMVLSLNVLDSTGSSVSVKNSSVPIIIHMNLIPTLDDPRFLPLPTYLADCTSGSIYVKSGREFMDASDIVNVTGRNKWTVPCLLGDKRFVNCSSSDTVIRYTCPPLIYTPKCQYWDSGLGAWSTDGCVPIFSNATLMICSCTHLTDFSSRIQAVTAANTNIINNAGNVYSLEGLIKFAQWYGIFGGIALLTLILGYVAMIIDRRGTTAYVKELLHNKSINPFLAHNPDTPVYSYDSSSKYSKVMKSKPTVLKNTIVDDEKPASSLSFCSRLFLQHNRLQFIFKYDPRLSRVFRLLFLFVLQFHSLFVTALLYNFTYSGQPMQWYDTILLALITTGLNMPVVRLVLQSMNKIGMLEFQKQFPLLYDEYKRRLDFEMYAMFYIFKNPDGGDDSLSESDIKNELGFIEDDDLSIFDILAIYLCNKSAPPSKKDEMLALSHKDAMRIMVNIVKEPYPYYEQYDSGWQSAPCHTWQGGLFIACCCGWLGWCLNYLLLFAAANESKVGETILTSYATSELTTVFLVQPLTIMMTTLVYYLVKRFEKYIPMFIKNIFISRKVKNIPPIYYFSDPWNKKSKSPFTSEFAYNLFVACPAAASGTNEMAYASIAALSETIDGSSANKLSEVLILYRRILSVWDDIKNGQGTAAAAAAAAAQKKAIDSPFAWK